MAQRGIFLGYSKRSKAYRVYNSETQCVEESMHIKFDDKELGSEIPELFESFAEIQVSEEPSEPEPIPEAQDEEVSDKAQDGSQQAIKLSQQHCIIKYTCPHIQQS
jgi:hypothetical protein